MAEKFITTREQYEKADRISDRLEKKIKDGVATDQERERYRVLRDHVVIYELAEKGREHRLRLKRAGML